ncbi:FAD-dependent oxidoreductase [Limibacter armeniacum]|uniref:NAD(P)/FAD-dependent oxidoreductase n=1 Tax=Limibacter armeniacum TaxID=466084 RepID=UPI002FE61E7D
MLSFWEQRHFVDYDYLIIGGGIVGLSTAASLAEKQPDKKIVLLERGIFPTGASTKNAGFACFGSLTELLSDLQSMERESVLGLVNDRWTGLRKLRDRLGEEAIGYHCHGGYELISDKQMPALQHIEAVNSMLLPIFGEPVFIQRNDLVKAFGFNREQTKALVYNQFEGQIDTGKMMRSLLGYVQSKSNVTLLTGCEVKDFEDDRNKVKVRVCNTVSGSEISFSADQVAVCTNAFTETLLPDLEIEPGRGQVLVTKPIDGLKFKGVFHMDEGYYYFRNYGNRVIFGGGRNQDFEGEATTEFKNTDHIINVLKEKLEKMILPDQTFEVEHQWAGIMAFGQSRQPICRRVSPKVVAGVRLGGMGVAIGSNLGERLALMMTEANS